MANDYDSILAKVSSILSEKIVTDTGKEGGLKADTPLLSSGLNLDSVAVLELLLALEKHFACRIEERDGTTANFQAIGSVTELVRRRLASGE